MKINADRLNTYPQELWINSNGIVCVQSANQDSDVWTQTSVLDSVEVNEDIKLSP